MRKRVAVRTVSIRIVATRTREPNPRYRIFSDLRKCGNSRSVPQETEWGRVPNHHPASSTPVHLDYPQAASLSQSKFLNRQVLYLRPDPARVVVRPFEPATEP